MGRVDCEHLGGNHWANKVNGENMRGGNRKQGELKRSSGGSSERTLDLEVRAVRKPTLL